MAARRSRARVEVHAERGVFMISVAAELAEMHPQTLRMYETRGLISPKRSAKGTRLYSRTDVERLRRIQEMTAELGLNLAGVERVLELEEEVARLRARVDMLERRDELLREQVAIEREQLRAAARAEIQRARAGRGELIVYQPAGALVSVRDHARHSLKPPREDRR